MVVALVVGRQRGADRGIGQPGSPFLAFYCGRKNGRKTDCGEFCPLKSEYQKCA
jgi:hypothetical protein